MSSENFSDYMPRKVFCIGFHKTGTTSLTAALRHLGYRVTGSNGVFDPNISKNAVKLARELSYEYDAFQDNPWPMVYKEMDSLHPGSKFILTIRDANNWIKSVVNHFGDESTPMREWIYGYGAPLGHEDIYQEVYETHNKEVKNYFQNRPDDLLVMDIENGDGWDKLCNFLGHDVPFKEFPHKKQKAKRNIVQRLLSRRHND